MPIPGLTDIYAFGDWLKREWRESGRKPLRILPVQGGLIFVEELDSEVRYDATVPKENP